MRTIILAAALAVAIPAAALAADAEADPRYVVPEEITTKAQFEMLSRIDSKITAFILARGIDPTFVSYCRTNMARDTQGEKVFPFNIVYSAIPSTDYLNTVIETREAFELSYLRLCLADAHKRLETR